MGKIKKLLKWLIKDDYKDGKDDIAYIVTMSLGLIFMVFLAEYWNPPHSVILHTIVFILILITLAVVVFLLNKLLRRILGEKNKRIKSGYTVWIYLVVFYIAMSVL